MGGAGGRLGILAISMLFLRGTYRGVELADELRRTEGADGEALDVGALDGGAPDVDALGGDTIDWLAKLLSCALAAVTIETDKARQHNVADVVLMPMLVIKRIPCSQYLPGGVDAKAPRLGLSNVLFIMLPMPQSSQGDGFERHSLSAATMKFETSDTTGSCTRRCAAEVSMSTSSYPNVTQSNTDEAIPNNTESHSKRLRAYKKCST